MSLKKLASNLRKKIAGEAEPEHDGMCVTFHDGSYIVCGAVPAEKNGTFDADGVRLPDVIPGVTPDDEEIDVKGLLLEPVGDH